MPSLSPEVLRVALGVAVGLVLFLVLRQAFRDWLRRRRLIDRFAKARQGESRARELLEARGYSVISAQSSKSYTLSLDGAEVAVPLRADYLVRRGGLRYVAEVKTGAFAPLIRTPATRRQLLEYLVAFEVDGVLLVDAEEGRVRVVRFPFSRQRAPERLSPFGWIIIAVGVAALIVTQWR